MQDFHAPTFVDTVHDFCYATLMQGLLLWIAWIKNFTLVLCNTGYVWQSYTLVFMLKIHRYFAYQCLIMPYHRIFESIKYQKIKYFKIKHFSSVFKIYNTNVLTCILKKRIC